MADGPKIPLKDKPGSNNWVDASGGLPDYIKRIAEHIKGENPEWDDGHCIATAVNQVKKWAAGGEGATAKTKAKAAAALAQWEAKKASTHASIQGDSDLALAAAALDDEFDEGAYRLALAAERASVGSTVEDDLDLVDGDAEIDEGRYMLAIQSERAARGIPLAGLTERRLDLSRSEDDTLNMAIHFDPQKHPRGLKGQFRSVVGGLKPGEKVELPDGISIESDSNVTKEGRILVVKQNGENRGVFRGQQKNQGSGAADLALHYSAKSTHKDSVGGPVSHSSVDSAIRADKSHAKRSESFTEKADRMADEDLKVPSKDASKPTGTQNLPSGQKVDWDRDPAKNSPAVNAEVARQTDLPKDVRQPFVDAHNDLAEKRGIPKIDINGKPISNGDASKRASWTSNVLKGNPADSDAGTVPAEKGDTLKSKAERGASKDGEAGTIPAKPKFQITRSRNGSSAADGDWTQHASGDLEIEMPDNGPTARISQDERGGRDKWGADVFATGDAVGSESRTDFDTADEARQWVESRIEAGDIKTDQDKNDDASPLADVDRMASALGPEWNITSGHGGWTINNPDGSFYSISNDDEWEVEFYPDEDADPEYGAGATLVEAARDAGFSFNAANKDGEPDPDAATAEKPTSLTEEREAGILSALYYEGDTDEFGISHALDGDDSGAMSARKEIDYLESLGLLEKVPNRFSGDLLDQYEWTMTDAGERRFHELDKKYDPK